MIELRRKNMENRKLPIVRSEKKEVIPVTISKKRYFLYAKNYLFFLHL